MTAVAATSSEGHDTLALVLALVALGLGVARGAFVDPAPLVSVAPPA